MRVVGIALVVVGILGAIASMLFPFLGSPPDPTQDPEGFQRTISDGVLVAFIGGGGGIVLSIVGAFLLVGSYFRKKAARDAMIRASGVAGVATIAQMRDTGVTVNDNPRVEFHLTIDLPGQRQYTMTTTRLVGRLQVGRLGIGRSFPCSVLPNERDAIVVDFDRDATPSGPPPATGHAQPPQSARSYPGF
jgi:hypothetical protein